MLLLLPATAADYLTFDDEYMAPDIPSYNDPPMALPNVSNGSIPYYNPPVPVHGFVPPPVITADEFIPPVVHVQPSQITYNVIELPPPTMPAAAPPPTTHTPTSPLVMVKSEPVTRPSLTLFPFQPLPVLPKVEVVPKAKKTPRRHLSHDQKMRHNKVEKKYRHNINTKIANLQNVIPWTATKVLNFECDEFTTETPIKTGGHKINKSEVLDIATNYILHLQGQSELMNQELMFLQLELAKFRHPLPPSPLGEQ